MMVMVEVEELKVWGWVLLELGFALEDLEYHDVCFGF